jgi:hypothetical protein
MATSSHRSGQWFVPDPAQDHRALGENFLYGFKPSPAGDGPDCAGQHARPRVFDSRGSLKRCRTFQCFSGRRSVEPSASALVMLSMAFLIIIP